MKTAPQYWLMKSEPSEYSIEDLKRDNRAPWFGVRNYLARNYMRDLMRQGDLILFYHSSCKEPGVVGVAKVASAPYPDETQFEKNGQYYDPKATKEKPRWMLVDVTFVKRFSQVIPLARLRQEKKPSSMVILRTGNRLSITPVTEKEFQAILGLAT
jgi:predicted RNA-binding protein with PUA-like domain